MNPLIRAAMGAHYTFFRLVVRLLVKDPASLDRLAKPLGKIRRRVGYIGPNRSPKKYLDAIQEALPDISLAKAEDILNDFWLNHQRKFLSLFIVPRLNQKNIEQWVEFQGLEHLDAAFALGIERVVLGTAALRDAGLVHSAVRDHGDKVAVALDARDGNLAAAGWLEQTESRATEVAARLRATGVARFVCTDIGRDGTLSGPNLLALAEMQDLLGSGVIASGGVGTADDIGRVAALGVEGVVVGKALYDGRVTLSEALQRARQRQHAR